MATTLRLLQGLSDPSPLDLNDRTATPYGFYLRPGWEPQVARRVRAAAVPFADVVDEIPIAVRGDDGDDVMAGIDVLYSLLDYGQRTIQNAFFEPLILEWSPIADETLRTKMARVTAIDAPVYSVTPTYNRDVRAYEVRLTLNIKHSPWLGTERYEGSFTSSGSDVISKSFAISDLGIGRGLAKLTIAAQSGTHPSDPAFLLTGAESGEVSVLEAYDYDSVGSGFTTPAESTYRARDNTLLRFTPTNTNWQTVYLSAGNGIVSTLGSSVRRSHVFMKMRSGQSSATDATWQLRVRADYGEWSLPITIDHYDLSDPRVIYIGQCSGDVGGIEIGIKTTSTTGTPRLDMNSGALLAADSETANALKFPNGVNGVQLTVDHGILEAGANIYTETVPGIPYVGNRHLLVTGDAMAILYLTTDNAYWIAEQSGSAITFDYRAYVRALLPHVGT